MELCNRHYGFFDMASLFMFVNPFSPHRAVRRAIYQPIRKALSSLDDEQAADLLQRYGTLIHERRHFHDIISTPLGNRLFRSYFAYAVLCFSVFKRCRWKGQQLPVPIRLPDISRDDLSQVETKREEILRLLDLATPAFELSAMMSQAQAAWSNLGAEAADAMMEDLLTNSSDRGLLELALIWSEKVGAFRGRLHRVVHKTVMAVGLGCANAPPESTGRMLRQSLRRIQELVSPPTESNIVKIESASEAAWQKLLGNLEEADAANYRLVTEVEKKLVNWPKEITELVVEVAQCFADEARRCHTVMRKEPERLLYGPEYLRRALELPQPRVYYFSDDDTLCAFDEPLPLHRMALAWQNVRTLPNGTKKYCHRLYPAERTQFHSERSGWIANLTNWVHRRTVGGPARGIHEIAGRWEDYAKAVVSCTALFEPVDWNHPFRAYSLREIGGLTGVTAVRRMA